MEAMRSVKANILMLTLKFFCMTYFTSFFIFQSTYGAEKGWRLTLGASATAMQYQQTGLSLLTEIMLTPNLKIEGFAKGGHWNLALDGYYLALPLTKVTSGNEMRYLSGEGKLGYFIGAKSSSWKLNFMVGGYYLTSQYLPGNEFGFQDFAGPLVSPVLRYVSKKNRQFWIYIKFAPLLGGVGSALQNSNLSAGLGFTLIRFSKRNQLNITFDASKLYFVYSSEKSLQSTSASSGLTFSF